MSKKILDKKIKNIVNEYLSLLEKDNFFIQKVFVFGSRVNGNYHINSDIDVAVISPNIKRSFHDQAFLLKKAHQLNNNKFYIEPHGFNPKDFIDESPIVWEIKQTGIRIK